LPINQHITINKILSNLKMQKNEVEKEISELKIQQQYLLRAGDQNDNLVKENKKTAHNINM
jgi:hypothetical protein